ncbi:MAG: acyl-CoA/acyl-ACP dehydrogenase [Deltaproteobacteria bacterium]|nr:acyl-CoA/acyl-ACP dehydrogenase [Deltaproteobacteria bacterium]MBW2391361.1 acyl-CoA/acyl-ACP dehydrogenase [Deltaproteobacteria bacterium]
MDFRPSQEQNDLKDGIANFCASRCSVVELRRIDEAGGFDLALWRDLADLGVFQLMVAEANQGLGLGVADAVLVFEALGERLVPGPLVFTQLAAGLIDGAMSGECVVGGLDLESNRQTPHLIEYKEQLDALLLLRDDGVYRVDPSALRGSSTLSLDPLTPVFHAEALPEGDKIADADRARRLRLEGMSLVAAELLGITEATLEIALAYAKEREQFGRVIGAFQAIKHLLADMFARQELVRASVYAAGATLDDPSVGDVEQAVRGARLLAAEAAVKNARTCIQIHGGMGYTWEVPDHYYLKRAMVLQNSFGEDRDHAAAIAEIVARVPLEIRYAG